MHNIIRIYFFRKEKIQFQIEFILSMDYLKILGLSSLSIFVLFILTKLMGNREMTQLSMFDYVVSITIGSIAAEMATALETDFMQPLIAMVVYAIITIIISYIANKSLVARRIINGKSVILFNNGKLYRENLKKAKLDLSEFLTQCRNQGYPNEHSIFWATVDKDLNLSIYDKISIKSERDKFQ